MADSGAFNIIRERGIPIMPTIPGLPFIQGNIYHVKPSSGNNGNTGDHPDSAFKTLAYAHSKMSADQNDICLMYAESNTAGSTTDYQSTTLTWSKDACHLIGVNAGQRLSHRARIALTSAYDTASNLMTVTADGCLFQGVELFEGVAGTNPTGCLKINAGTRNHFRNCHIAGIGNDANDIAGAYSLSLIGNATENYFEDCVIGVDTISRGSADSIYEIYMDTSTGVVSGLKPARNIFKGCYVLGLAGSATQYLFLKIASGGADRFVMFDGCHFINAGTTVGGGSTMNYAFSVASDANGKVILAGGTSITGAADVADNPGNIFSASGIPSATDAGLTIAVVKT